MPATESIFMKPRYKVAMLIYEEFTMLDLIGPADVLGGSSDKFDLHVVGNSEVIEAQIRAFKFQTCMSMDQAIAEPEPFDMLVIPGGTDGTERASQDRNYLRQIRALSEKASIVFSVCTGSLILAAAGLLDGKNATTNKFIYHQLTPAFPTVQWKLHARWVEDGKFITSSGITAGTDAAFYILSKIKGRKHAEALGQLLEYNVIWDADNDQFAREKHEPQLEFPIKE